MSRRIPFALLFIGFVSSLQTVLAQTPPAATLAAPTGTIQTALPTYTWNAVAGATDYQLLVHDSSSNVIVSTWYASASVCSGGTCSAAPSVALANGAHQWWIQARNGSGDGPWSSGMSFTVSAFGAIGTAEASSYSATRLGAPWSWGENGSGQLGDGTATDRLIPTSVAGVSDAKTVLGGAGHGVALTHAAAVW